MAANLVVARRPHLFSRCTRSLSSSSYHSPIVALVFQAIDPPVINGVRKPRKPGGYQDSGADIAYALRQKGVRVLTPTPSPSESSHEGWSFPDTKEGSTLPFSKVLLTSGQTPPCSLQCSPDVKQINSSCVQSLRRWAAGTLGRLDDKAFLNNKLRELGSFTLPRAWMVHPDNLREIVKQIDRYPIVGKPVRGRGNHGVRVCHDAAQLQQHAEALLAESPLIMLEEFLTGEEATITVMPPTPSRPDYWSMVPVARFNHADGIAPYNGLVAVTANSRAVSQEEMRDPAYNKMIRQCEGVARLIGATAPIRIDVRRFHERSEFALFDTNMKPNMTGPGRPGREDQASLTAIAAEAMSWDYGTLLQRILEALNPWIDSVTTAVHSSHSLARRERRLSLTVKFSYSISRTPFPDTRTPSGIVLRLHSRNDVKPVIPIRKSHL